jgi:hypothetical protein
MSQETQPCTQQQHFSVEEASNAGSQRRWGCCVPNGNRPPVDLYESRVTLGRKKNSTIFFDVQAISGLHCVIEMTENASEKSRTVFVSNESTNGLWLMEGAHAVPIPKHGRQLIATGTEIVLIPAVKNVREKVSVVIYIDELGGNVEQGGPHLKYDLRDHLGSGAFATVCVFCARHPL